MEILLNGSAHQLDAPYSVSALVAQLQLTGQAIAVAVNRNVITRQHWDTCTLNTHDQVDVVRAIGGG